MGYHEHSCEQYKQQLSTPLRESDEIRSETTVSSVQKIFQRQDILFKSTCETLKHKMFVAFETDTIERFLKEMEEKAHIRDMKDHLGRTFYILRLKNKILFLFNV